MVHVVSRQPVQRRGTNLGRVAGFNASVILDLIRRADDGMSRVELSSLSGLSAQTVTNISRRLLEDELIDERLRSISDAGKRRRVLRLRPDGRYVIGVALDPAVIDLVVVNLAGDIVARKHQPMLSDDPAEVMELVRSTVELLISSSVADRSRVLGIGIASPGPIDHERGLVLDPPHLHGWHQVPLRDDLHEATGLPVLLDKDVIATTMAERWSGPSPHSDNFMFFYFGTGIGISLVTNDLLLRGVSGNFGDIGRMRVRSPRAETLEDASLPACILQRARETGHGNDLASDSPAALRQSFSTLCRRAEDIPELGELLDDAARSIGETCAVVSNLFDLDLIVLGGPMWAGVSDRFLPVINDAVQSQSLAAAVHPVHVVGTALGEDVGALGAACLVLDTTLSPNPTRLPLQSESEGSSYA